ncbi:MAG: response regulator [Bacteroidales bacterium]
MIRIIITDDHPIVRQGIKQILEDDRDQRFVVIDEATDSSDLLDKVLHNEYDVVLLDISLPGRSGLDILPDLKKRSPNARVIMLSMYPEEQYAVKALKSGASGYLTKSSAPEELISAVVKVSNGERYITSGLAEIITRNFFYGSGEQPHDLLSARELEVIKLLASGNKLNQIAGILALSPKTVSTYRSRILEKLNLKTTAEIIRYAFNNNIE